MDEDGWDAVRPFLAELRVNYRTLLGTDLVAQQFGGVDALPTTFVIDREGKIASTHVGLVAKRDYENDIQALLASALARSGRLAPARWTVGPARRDPLSRRPRRKREWSRNADASAKLSVRLRNGYHVNSNTPADEYLIPLGLTWNSSPLEVREIVYPKPQMQKYSFSTKPVSVYSGDFEIVTRFTVPAKAPLGASRRDRQATLPGVNEFHVPSSQDRGGEAAGRDPANSETAAHPARRDRRLHPVPAGHGEPEGRLHGGLGGIPESAAGAFRGQGRSIASTGLDLVGLPDVEPPPG